MPLKGQRTGITTNCEWCGKEIYQTKTQYNRAVHHFCSVNCQKQFLHKETYEIRNCEICGKPFEVAKKDTKRFCSIQCQGKWQSTQIGELNPRSKRIIYPCDNCGKTVRVMPCEEKLFKHHFCSDQCRIDWYASVYSQDEEWKHISQKRAIDMLEQGAFSHTNTKPQIAINELLDKMGIEYINEKEFNYFCVDNYLPYKNLIIEVMGDYWHASPLRYTLEQLNQKQKTRVSKDRIKHNQILTYHKIEILYLWENDIMNNLDLCEILIQAYLDSCGVLLNYHSFNYEYRNEQLLLKNQLIVPYQDLETA